MAGRGMKVISRFTATVKRTGYISLLAVSVSLGAALFSALFIMILRTAHPLLFSLTRYPLLFILIPAFGLMAAQFVSFRWAQGVKGHGVPEIQYSVRDRDGVIPLRGAAAKTLSSLITILAGGSAGQAGPVALIGAVAGSAFGNFLHLQKQERMILVGSGVASAITVLFHTPVTALLFTLELIYIRYSVSTVIPITISTAVVFSGLSAAGLSYPLIPLEPGFSLSPSFIVAALLTVIFSSLIVWGWGKVQFGIESFFIRSTIPQAFEAFIAGLLVGLLSLLSYRISGTAMVSAADTAFLTQLFQGSFPSPLILLLLLTMKFIANPLTLGAGGSGGVFAPSLFLGASAGFVTAGTVALFLPLSFDAVLICSLVGMSAVLAGVSGAVFTAIVLATEMTGSLSLLPVVACGTGISVLLTRRMNKDTFYSAKLKKNESERGEERQSAV